MASTGCCVEAAYWAKNGVKVTAVDKAAFTRSGPCYGLSAITNISGVNEGQNTCEIMCIMSARTSWASPERTWCLIAPATWTPRSICSKNGACPFGWMKRPLRPRRPLAAHDQTVNLQVIVAPGRQERPWTPAGFEIYERVFIVAPILDGDRIAGAVVSGPATRSFMSSRPRP